MEKEKKKHKKIENKKNKTTHIPNIIYFDQWCQMFRNFAVEAVKLWDLLSCKGNTVNATYPRQIDQCEQSKSCLRTEAKGITSPVIPSYLPSPWLSNKCGLGCLRASIGANIFFLLLIICYVKRYLIKSWFSRSRLYTFW